MTPEKLDDLRHQLSVELKNGINFTLAAAITWLVIAYVWTLQYTSYNRSVFVFMVGALMLPLAFLFSKLIKAKWRVASNTLQPLGLWLNLAQLFYFPFLILTLIKMPDYFMVVYAIITGAHFFPYAWFYKTLWYAVFAAIISLGALFLALYLPAETLYIVGLNTSVSLLVLTLGLYFDVKQKQLLLKSN